MRYSAMSRKGKTGQAHVLNGKDLEKVLRDIRGGNPRFRNRNTCIIIMSHYLGLRAKELASLKVSDVLNNLAIKEVLKLKASYTKGHKHRDVPLTNKKVIQALNALLPTPIKNDDLPLFKSQKGWHFSANAMVQLIKKIYVSAGFNECSSHSGRRSMITNLANKGVDVNSIRIIAGHTSISTTQRYIESNPEMLANIMQGL